MNTTFTDQFIPVQYTGSQTEAIESFVAADEKQARDSFQLARKRLMNINEWHTYCGFLSPAFQHSDAQGQPVNRDPQAGDYIKIDIPGPGTAVGRGFDWVVIERVSYTEIDPQQEIFYMQARPAAYPFSGEQEIAHFYKSSATSSFLLVREMNQLTAAVYGRNEVPNTDSQHLLDRIRNQVVGSSGAIGLSFMQWKTLVRALLEDQTK